MPLHLLGKKSWNVYNTDNVERVRRDEADARASEEAAEQLMQEQDAEHRMALLRGEEPPALPEPANESHENEYAHGPRRRADDAAAPRDRKRRRLKGEDDTERELRYAREDVEASSRVRESLRAKPKGGSDAPLQDHRGHIQLVSAPDEKHSRKSETSKDERVSKRKREEEEQQQQGMRFSDAAGYRKGMNKPWYAASDGPSREYNHKPASELVLDEAPGKDVWGNEDPRRVERERTRLVSSDPFAMMQQAQKQLKRSEDDRGKWQAERDREMLQLKTDEERKRRHDRKHESRRRSRRDDEHDGLEGFSLDGHTTESKGDHEGHRRHRHSRRHRSRERSRSRSREHRRR
jgi:hypothetical protein